MYTVFIYKHTCNSINETIILPFSVCVCVCACVRACVCVCDCMFQIYVFVFKFSKCHHVHIPTVVVYS